MNKFSDIVRQVRLEAGLSQSQFAKKLDVSAIYISKIETDQKDASKNFVQKLAKYVGVHPAALAPFLFLNPDVEVSELSSLERQLISIGEQLQQRLIKKRVQNHDQ